MIEAVRLINGATWSPDGRTVFIFSQDEIVTASDPRAAGGFIQTAVRSGWAEPIAREPEPDRVEAMTSPAPEPEPARRTAARAGAPRTASQPAPRATPKRKRKRKPTPTE